MNLNDMIDSPERFAFARALREGPGFDLEIEGSSWTKFFSLRETEATPDGQRLHWVDDEHGLELVVTYTYYPRHNALLYGGRLYHHGKAPVHSVKIHNVSWEFDTKPIEEVMVLTCRGGTTNGTYPSDAFELNESTFLKINDYWDSASLERDSGPQGAASNNWLPFWIMEDGQRKSSLFAALSWVGHWSLTMRKQPGTLRIVADFAKLDAVLYPGESVPIPEVLIGFTEGDQYKASNTLRRFISEEILPPLNGKRYLPPVYYCSWWGNRGWGWGEAEMYAEMEVAAKLGVEYFWIDDGWQVGWPQDGGVPYNDRPFDWDVPDPIKFPHGIEPLYDRVRELGMNAGLWLGVEWTTPYSKLPGEHPDWIGYFPDWLCMVNLGIPEALEWAKRIYDRDIKRYNLKLVRVEGYRTNYQQLDPPERQGMTEIRHIEGFYALMDYLLETYPDLVLDQCSGGGRRIALGTLRRGHTTWFSDFTSRENYCRSALSGSNRFLPGAALDTNLNNLDPGPYGPEIFHSFFGGTFGFGERLREWDADKIEAAKTHLRVYKQIRHLINEDFYPLFPQPKHRDDPDGWQFHNPTTSEGFILLFRAEHSGKLSAVCLRGLESETVYAFEDPYAVEVWPKALGRNLVEGLTFEVDAGKSLLVTYRPSEENAS